MEGVHGRVLGRAYTEEPRRSRLTFEEDEMDVAAVGTHGERRWEPLSTSRQRSWYQRPRTPLSRKT